MSRVVCAGALAALVVVVACGGSHAAAPACTPTTCAAAGATCGELPDGCGGTLACGTCAQGEACGGGQPNVCGPATCVPTTCEGLGKDCGPVSDGCGHVLDCGACPQGETCGGGGVENVCGRPACVPSTCQSLAKNCGDVGDGCGGTLHCGTCPAGQTCGGAGTANVCGPAACTPTTCAAQKKNCGKISDGCGRELDCGTCPQGQQCGAGGTANVCAAPPTPPPPPGNVRWSFAVSSPGPDQAWAAGGDDAGDRLLLSVTPDETGNTHTLRIDARRPDGSEAWSRTWPFRASLPWSGPFTMAVTPLGNVLVLARPACDRSDCTNAIDADLGGGAITSGAVVKLDPDGGFLWQQTYPGAVAYSVATDDAGDALVAWAPPSTALQLDKLRWDGTRLFRVDTGVRRDVGFAATLTPSGDALVAGSTGEGFVLQRLGATGDVSWREPLPGGGYVFGIGATAKSTVVVLALRTGDVSFGGSTVRSGTFVLYAFEADGSPRWAQGVEALGAPTLAVDPTGRLAVVGQGSGCGELVLQALNLDGSALWRRSLPTDEKTCWSVSSPLAAFYGANHELFVGASFWSTVMLGDATYSPRGMDAFGAELAP
ncbi:PQQ-like beta-propeller repeat protein [Anaeromyxobacter oryzae]|uniref:Pyrrolo-quinoline quinone n=1 Tax=Anaeromyxobacter oryzae TaxID=2918170 RepID=A0ABN6N3R9_9BACT|nr:PQQ-like beta-propeller repeat protein [Anaeromyxobacter oryzae]BDG06678.1 hypothetical protein AMOR_56740 [Anaeromyxobacter oryzae]